MWLSSAIGLQDRWWAGISAVVATADTLGATVGTAALRIAATLVGLMVGLAAAALSAHGVLVSGLTVVVVLVVLFELSLDAGARLGAATTLSSLPHRDQMRVSEALTRGANVPLGCAVAVAVGMVFVGHRAGDRLRRDLRRDVDDAGALAAAALSIWNDPQDTQALHESLAALLASRPARAAALRDAAREPNEHGDRLTALARQVDSTDRLVTATATLVELAIDGSTDRAPRVFADTLQRVASALAAGARAFSAGAPDDVIDITRARLTAAVSDLDRGYSAAREERTLARTGDAELIRMLSVIRAVHAAADALDSLEPVREHAARRYCARSQ